MTVRLQTVVDHYEVQATRMAALLDATDTSGTETSAAARTEWGPIVEQYDALIRHLGHWPAVGVWDPDRTAAVHAAHNQLSEILGELLKDHRQTHREWCRPQITDRLHRLCQTLADRNSALTCSGARDASGWAGETYLGM
ncbi:hypothetical protein [Streptomyces mirabilis]